MDQLVNLTLMRMMIEDDEEFSFVDDALMDLRLEKERWKCILDNQTWDLVGTLHKMVIGKKWAWKIDDKAYDSMDKYNVGLVV